ncbi:MAG: acyltransferase family protein [Pseudomonadota bacterium]
MNNERRAMRSSVKQSNGYIPGIDGLRAVAVLSVLLFHMRATFLPGGFAGVDVFFVISGYVVSASLAHRPELHFGRYLLGFYTRRIVRIFPALLLCVLLTGVATSLLVPVSWLSETTSYTGMASVFGLSNFALVWYSDGYFSPRAEFNPFTHTWSLAVEEQFYLIFPLLFFMWFRHRSRSDVIGWLCRQLIPIALLASLGYCAYGTSTRQELAYYMLPSRFWELASGAMLFRLHHAGRCLPTGPRFAGASIVAGAALIGLTFVWADAKAFPFPWAIPAVLGAMLIIIGSVGDIARSSWPGALMGSRPMTDIGKISYSLYLWHWPVLVLLRWTIGLDSAAYLVLAAAMSFALAVFSYHRIEQGAWWRLRIAGWKTGRIAAYGIAGMILSALCLGAVLKSRPYISLSVTRDQQTWYPQSWPSATAQQPAPANMLTGRKIFVWGDSHAGAYSTMLQILREQTGAQVFVYSRGGCAVAALDNPAATQCRAWVAETATEITSKASAGDVVFLASLRVPRLVDQWEVLGTPSSVHGSAAPLDVKRLQSVQEAAALVDIFERVGMRVIIDAPKPIFKSPPFRCSDAFNANNPICAGGFVLERSFLESHRQPTMNALAHLKALHPSLVVWDPFPILCPGNACSAFDGSVPLFFDGDHLSAHGNRMLYPSFLDVVMSSLRDRATQIP